MIANLGRYRFSNYFGINYLLNKKVILSDLKVNMVLQTVYARETLNSKRFFDASYREQQHANALRFTAAGATVSVIYYLSLDQAKKALFYANKG